MSFMTGRRTRALEKLALLLVWLTSSGCLMLVPDSASAESTDSLARVPGRAI